MNVRHECHPDGDTALVDLVDFKWLMAGDGWWVDVPRLRRDAAYANQCVRHGMSSGTEVLRRRALQVLALLPAACQGEAA